MNVPRLHEDPVRTTSRGLARYASEFMEAALAADEKMGNKKGYEIVAPIPVMFLVGHAIELTLKAFLLARGVTLRELRKEYGHELHRSLIKAKELGLLSVVALDTDDINAIELLDHLYASKQLEYIVTGAKTYPVFGQLERAALKLIHGVGLDVGFPPPDLPNVF